MNQREIITLMHKLFQSDIDKSDGYEHVFENDDLSEEKLNNFIKQYIETDKVLVYVNSQNAFECKTSSIYSKIKAFIKKDRIRIASPCFSGKILTETTGVAVGSLTRRSSRDAKKRRAPYPKR
ncbi:MAG: hypothetical protein U9N57_03825 [Pseudomonadota bacterium]|nr:hypothetical protein [Pseudomonadota bacterium]